MNLKKSKSISEKISSRYSSSIPEVSPTKFGIKNRHIHKFTDKLFILILLEIINRFEFQKTFNKDLLEKISLYSYIN